jgi:hypothetical protein
MDTQSMFRPDTSVRMSSSLRMSAFFYFQPFTRTNGRLSTDAA